MSGFTFSAPTTATSGLQPYNLDRGVKNLAPGSSLLTVLRQRAAARRRKLQPRGGQQGKDQAVMSGMLKSMVGTLTTSAQSIMNSDAPDRDALLEKSFGEFGDILTKFIDTEVATRTAELSKRAPLDDLYKGMGTVGRIARTVSNLTDQIANIEAGCDYSGQTPAKGDKADTPSETALAFLHHSLAAAELALRQAVNEHVKIADDDDTGSDVSVVKSADGHEVRIKGNLPNDLMKFACHPTDLTAAVADQAAGMLLDLGVSEKALEKLFAGDTTLAKGFPPGDDGSAGDGSGDPAQGGVGDDGSGDDGTSDVDDPMEALNVVGRLLAAGMIQVDGLLRMFQGAAGDGSNSDDTTAGSAPAAPAQQAAAPGGSEPAAEENKKDKPVKPGAGGMQKLADAPAVDPAYAALQKQFDDMQAKLSKVLASPQTPKGAIALFNNDLAKSGDSTNLGEADELAIAEALNKMTPADQQQAMIKIAQGVDPKRAARLI